MAWGLLERDHSFRRLLQYGFERHNALCHKALQRLSALSFFTLLLGELLQNDVGTARLAAIFLGLLIRLLAAAVSGSGSRA
jgi:hypothetical protein